MQRNRGTVGTEEQRNKRHTMPVPGQLNDPAPAIPSFECLFNLTGFLIIICILIFF